MSASVSHAVLTLPSQQHIIFVDKCYILTFSHSLPRFCRGNIYNFPSLSLCYLIRIEARPDCNGWYTAQNLPLPLVYKYVLSLFAEHQNYFGVDENMGPVAISIKREKVNPSHRLHDPLGRQVIDVNAKPNTEQNVQQQYRVIVRSSEVCMTGICFSCVMGCLRSS